MEYRINYRHVYYFTFWQKLITWYQEWGRKHGQYESIRLYLELKIRINLCLSGDIAETCKEWKQRWTLYVLATGAAEKDKPVQCGILLAWLDKNVLTSSISLSFPRMKWIKYSPFFKSLISICPKKNITYERYLFLNCTQRDAHLAIF